MPPAVQRRSPPLNVSVRAVQLSSHPASQAALDSTAFPHILERVIEFADHDTLFTLRCTSYRVHQLVEPHLYAHVKLGPSRMGEDDFGLGFTTPMDQPLPGFPALSRGEWFTHRNRNYDNYLSSPWRLVAQRFRHTRMLDVLDNSEGVLSWVYQHLDPAFMCVFCNLDGTYPEVSHRAQTVVMLPPTQPAVRATAAPRRDSMSFKPSTRRVIHFINVSATPRQPFLRAQLNRRAARLWDRTPESCQDGCGDCFTPACKSRPVGAPPNPPRGPRTHAEADGSATKSALSNGAVVPRQEVILFSEPVPNPPPTMLNTELRTVHPIPPRYRALAAELAVRLLLGSSLTLVDIGAVELWLQFEPATPQAEYRDVLVQAIVAELSRVAPPGAALRWDDDEEPLPEVVSKAVAAEIVSSRLQFMTRAEWEAGLSGEDIAAFTLPQFVSVRCEVVLTPGTR